MEYDNGVSRHSMDEWLSMRRFTAGMESEVISAAVVCSAADMASVTVMTDVFNMQA